MEPTRARTREATGRDSEAARDPRGYQPPGIEWEESIDVKANLASACSKIGGDVLCGAIGTS